MFQKLDRAVQDGEPFGVLIGDYAWDAGETDLRTLRCIAGLAAQAQAPFLSAAAPALRARATPTASSSATRSRHERVA